MQRNIIQFTELKQDVIKASKIKFILVFKFQVPGTFE